MTSRATASLGTVALLAVTAAMSLAHADSPGMSGNAEAYAADVDRQLEQLSRKIATADGEIEKIQRENSVVRQRMIARGRAYYRLVHAGLLPLGSGFDTLAAHTAKVERLRTALEKDIAIAGNLNQRKLALDAQRDKLVDRLAPLQMKQKAMAQARAALMEADDRQRAFERAFSSSVGPDYMAIYGAMTSPLGPVGPNDAPTPTFEGFRTLRGRLPFPLAGRAEVRLVNRPGVGGPGVEMRAAPGTPVRAVHAGRAAFADEYPSYGRVVILDHGEQYFTVSGNLGSIDIRVGEEVATGSRIGTVGRAGKQGVLYFELRHGANTIDPTPWLGL